MARVKSREREVRLIELDMLRYIQFVHGRMKAMECTVEIEQPKKIQGIDLGFNLLEVYGLRIT